MKRIVIFLTILFAFNLPTFAQTDKEKAETIGQKAIRLMDDGQLDESIKLLEEANALDPKRIDYPYEKALALYRKEIYQEAISILEGLKGHKDVMDRVYQLQGNAYDILGDAEKAMEIYQIGLQKFPKSGILYLEYGVVKLSQEKYEEAAILWEKGVKVDPNFPSNYYWLARLYSGSKEKIWGLFYSEIFLLLEPGTKRSKEISKLLFDTYKKSYIRESETSGEFDLTEAGFKIVVKNKKDLKKLDDKLLPFEGSYMFSFSPAAINFMSDINMATIAGARARFLHFWFEVNKTNKVYPNALLNYQRKIDKAGLMEPYTYWLLVYGDELRYQAWFKSNEASAKKCSEWLRSNQINLKSSEKYSISDYRE